MTYNTRENIFIAVQTKSMIVYIELITFKSIFQTMPSKMALDIECNHFHLRINLTLLVGYTKCFY